VLVSSCWLVAAGSCLAVDAEAAAAIAFVDTLVVAGGAMAGPTVPSTGSLITRIDLDDQPGFADLSEVLGRVAGLQMARLGGWGATAVPSLRGSAPAQIRFFLDGVPLPDAQTGLAGFGRVPLDRLQAIEVHRGVVPAGLGGVGGAGAINFISRDRDDGLDVVIQTGAFGERGGRLMAGAVSAAGDRSGQVIVHGHRANNDFEFLDHNQTFHRADDDTVRVRENAWLEEWGAWGSGRWTSGELNMRGSLGFARRDGGRPGPLGYASGRASVRYSRADAQAHLDWRTGLLRADLAAGRGREFLYDPDGEVGFAPPGTSESRSEDASVRLAWSPALRADRLDGNFGVEARGQWQTETLAGTTDPERSRQTISAFSALTLRLADDRLRIVPTWRWQHSRNDFPGVPAFPWLPVDEAADNRRDDVSPSLGVVWTLTPGRLYLESHAARTVRVPTWVEIFGHRGGVDGNRELQPEEITAADLAFSLRDDQGRSGRVAAFYAETDAKIIFVQNSQRTSKPINLGRTVARGVEVEGEWPLAADLALSGNLTVQNVTDRGDDPAYRGNRVPYLPDVEAYTRLSVRPGRWRPWLEWVYRSDNFRDRANSELDQAPARTLWNLGISRDWYPRWLGTAGVLSLLAEAINLTDNAVYDVEGFPLPGRSWHLSIRLRR